MRDSKTTKIVQELRKNLSGMKTQKPKLPERPFRIRIITSAKVKSGLHYSAVGSIFIREIRNPCYSSYAKFRDEYAGWLASIGTPNKAYYRELETLEFDNKISLQLRKMTKCEGFPEGIDQGYWDEIIVGGSYSTGALKALSEIGMEAFRAGWIPLLWIGRYPAGYLAVYPLPKHGLPVPREWLISKHEKEAAKPILSKAIDRSEFPVPKIKVTPTAAWKRRVSLPVAKGISQALEGLVIGGGKAGKQVVASLAKKAVSLSIGGSVKSPTLIYTFTAKSGKPVTLTAQAPWTGSLAGLPPAMAQVLRQHNGMGLSEGAPKPRWIPYGGPASGFKFEWGVWEIADDHTEPSAWKRKPLAPFSNGSDLWVYHPARKMGKTLELVKLDHDGSEWEPEPEQHPGVRFLNVVLGVLNVI